MVIVPLSQIINYINKHVKYIIKSSIDIQMFNIITILRLDGFLLFLLLVFVHCVGHCTYMECWRGRKGVGSSGAGVTDSGELS